MIMTNIIKIESQLPVITADFDAEKARLTAELEKYQNVVVTEETQKADKKLAQELSAMGKTYKADRIAMVKSISAPIKVFEGQMNDLETLCSSTALTISKQVKVFEAEKLAKVEVLVKDYAFQLRDELAIKEQFYTVDFEGIAKITSVTPKFLLNKGTKDKVQAIVNAELALQQKIAFRLLQLENESHKAGLLSPLVEVNVESFLYESDEVYAHRLEQIISSELGRQKQAEERLRIKAEQEAELKAKAEAEQKSKEQVVEEKPIAERLDERFKDVPSTEQHPTDQVFGTQEEATGNQMPIAEQPVYEQPAKQMVDGNIPLSVVATFNIAVPSHIKDEMVIIKLKKMLAKAGFSDDALQSIVVNR